MAQRWVIGGGCDRRGGVIGGGCGVIGRGVIGGGGVMTQIGSKSRVSLKITSWKILHPPTSTPKTLNKKKQHKMLKNITVLFELVIFSYTVLFQTRTCMKICSACR